MSCWEYLAKYQHANYNMKVVKLLKNKLDRGHRFLAALRLMNGVKLGKKEIEKMIAKDKIYQALTTFPTYK